MHDLPSLRASGTSGETRVGYQRATTLGDWSLTLLQKLPRTFELRARVISEHDYWSQQQPQTVVLWLGLTAWTWKDVSLSREGNEFVVELVDRPTVSVEAEGEQSNG